MSLEPDVPNPLEPQDNVTAPSGPPPAPVPGTPEPGQPCATEPMDEEDQLS